MDLEEKLHSLVDTLEKEQSVGKSKDSKGNLRYLDNALNDGLAQALKAAFRGRFIAKCANAFLGYETAVDVHHFNAYGHLRVDDKTFRVSTCIDLRKKTVKIPLDEKQYWGKKVFLCYTTGHFFAVVDTSKIGTCLSSEDAVGNIEYNILELYMRGAVPKFGTFTDDVINVPGVAIALKRKEVKLPRKFKSIKLKSCKQAYKPKYALVRMTDSRYCEFYTTLDAVKKRAKIKASPQYIGRIAKQNAQLLEEAYGRLSNNDTEVFLQKCKPFIVRDKSFAVVAINELTGNLPMLGDILTKNERMQDNIDYAEQQKYSAPISKEEAETYINGKTGKHVTNVSLIERHYLCYSKRACDECLLLSQFKFKEDTVGKRLVS